MLPSDTMLPSICVVVPTYWTRSGGLSRQGDAVYDHPTPVDGRSTLPPLLESLSGLETSTFYLLLLVAVTGEDVAQQAEERVRRLAAEYPSLTTLIFGRPQLDQLHAWLRAESFGDAEEYLSLREYARIRNLQLAIPFALGSTMIVALDDDEIVSDPRFVEKATEPLGSTIGGTTVDGLSGYYLQDDGSIYLRAGTGRRTTNIFAEKAAIMNAATAELEAKPAQIVETPFCFGGNMEFTRDLVAAVGFDPGITRGEDIDYLINARMEGRTFFLRKDLRVLHRPPEGGSYKDSTHSKLEQDVLRFIYEREKLLASQRSPDLRDVTADALMPYPGSFLQDDIAAQATEALLQAAFPGDADEFVRSAQQAATGKIEAYLTFRRRWPALLRALSGAEVFRDLETQMESARA